MSSTSYLFRALALAGCAALALAGCRRQSVVAQTPPSLLLRVSPPSPARLYPGTLVRVTAWTQPKVALDWLSGTVRILGAPVMAFHHRADGKWTFRTMVPPMVSVPAGTYHIKAWGRTHAGQQVRGELTYEVE